MLESPAAKLQRKSHIGEVRVCMSCKKIGEIPRRSLQGGLRPGGNEQ